MAIVEEDHMVEDRMVEDQELTEEANKKSLDLSALKGVKKVKEIKEAKEVKKVKEDNRDSEGSKVKEDNKDNRDSEDSKVKEDNKDRECSFSIEERKRVLEALLFVSNKPIGLSMMVSAFGFDEKNNPLVFNKEIEETLESYKADLEEQNRGYRLSSVSGGYQLRTSKEMKPFLQNTIKARTFRLTGPTLETLAIVAYKQPITKSQVDDIRGVDSSHLIRGLMDKDLLAFAGKSELPGKPMIYKTTTRFLEIFGLRNLNELPSLSEIEALIPEGIGNEEEQEKGQEEDTLSQLTGKLSEDGGDSYSVSEEEHDKIMGELSQISTSTEFFEEEKKREREKRNLEKAEGIREALMVGEEISGRDKKWLERFDEKMKMGEESSSEKVSEEASLEEASEEASLEEASLEEASEEASLEEASEELSEGSSEESSEDSLEEALKEAVEIKAKGEAKGEAEGEDKGEARDEDEVGDEDEIKDEVRTIDPLTP